MREPVTTTRILIGAGTYADAHTAIHIAELLASILPTEMGGVLIEDSQLIGMAQLPGQRVITSGGTLLVAPSASQAQSLIASDARAFRQTLARMAQTRALKWTFEQRRGDLIACLCEAARGWDILLLGFRRLQRPHGRVVVIEPPMNTSTTVERLAIDLARALAADILTLAMGSDAVSPGEVVQTSATNSRIELNNAERLLSCLNRINAAAVVVDLTAGPLHSPDQLRQLLNAARCPVVVLRATGHDLGSEAGATPG